MGRWRRACTRASGGAQERRPELAQEGGHDAVLVGTLEGRR
jgi:hypothetical protein